MPPRRIQRVGLFASTKHFIFLSTILRTVNGDQPDVAKKSAEPALEEQLDLNERAIVCDAVESLVDDLQRGGAFDGRAEHPTGQFVWAPHAARVFRLVRTLEKYEERLIGELNKLSAQVRRFGAAGAFALPSGIQAADALAKSLNERAVQIRNITKSLGLQEAEVEERSRALIDLDSAAAAQSKANHPPS